MEHLLEDYFIRNIPMLMVLLALIFSGFTIHHHKERVSNNFVIDVFTGYFLFFVVGIVNIWGFFLNVFFAEHLAAYTGWIGGPFHFEMIATQLGLGIAGILAIRESFDFRVATTIIATCFFWGTAIDHMRTLVLTNHFRTDLMISSTFYVTVLIPIVLIILLIARGNSLRRNI